MVNMHRLVRTHFRPAAKEELTNQQLGVQKAAFYTKNMMQPDAYPKHDAKIIMVNIQRRRPDTFSSRSKRRVNITAALQEVRLGDSDNRRKETYTTTERSNNTCNQSFLM